MAHEDIFINIGMYNLYQLLNIIVSFPDSKLRTVEFKTLIFKGLNPQSDVERDIINERISALIKGEIRKRFNGKEAQYYCQKIDETKRLCDFFARKLD